MVWDPGIRVRGSILSVDQRREDTRVIRIGYWIVSDDVDEGRAVCFGVLSLRGWWVPTVPGPSRVWIVVDNPYRSRQGWVGPVLCSWGVYTWVVRIWDPSEVRFIVVSLNSVSLNRHLILPYATP